MLSIVISKTASSPAPAPGAGIASCLRAAFADARLIDLDTDVTSLPNPLVDARWSRVDSLEERLEELGAWFFPGAIGDAERFGAFRSERMMLPPASALEHISSPAVPVAEALGFQAPPFVPIAAGPREVYDFCAHHDWDVVAKARGREAVRVRSWPELQDAAGMSYVQASVPGLRSGIAFCALEGRLLEAVRMDAHETNGPITWAGQIERCDPKLADAIATLLRTLTWTGGGELVVVTDGNGDAWLTDIHPHFPEWIQAAATLGRNLPARLISELRGEPSADSANSRAVPSRTR
jgi:hypothetical protein